MSKAPTERIFDTGGQQAIVVALKDDKVIVSLKCTSVYGAAVLHDDIRSRLEEGDTVTITLCGRRKPKEG